MLLREALQPETKIVATENPENSIGIVFAREFGANCSVELQTQWWSLLVLVIVAGSPQRGHSNARIAVVGRRGYSRAWLNVMKERDWSNVRLYVVGAGGAKYKLDCCRKCAGGFRVSIEEEVKDSVLQLLWESLDVLIEGSIGRSHRELCESSRFE